MENSFWKRAVWEAAKAALSATAFCIIAEAIFALIVRACAPSQGMITAVNYLIKGLGIFVFSMIFIRRDRAFFKGLAAGFCSVFLTMFLFAAIGGGFHVGIWFLLELPLCVLLGGAGALLGAKFGKD
ncbi:MAG: DUF3792 family protein [Clostridia bacterium]|nr:DUF3792 family protein [Clostridia bacterium]